MKTNLSILPFIFIFIGSAAHAQCLEAEYLFNGNASDSSGNGHHATTYGPTSTSGITGTSNSAYMFDGNDYIDTKTSFDYATRSISIWFYSTQIDTDPHVIMEQNALSLTYGAVGLRTRNDTLYGNAGGEGGTLIYDGINENEWYHVVLIRDGNQTLYYLNGDKLITGTASSGASSTDQYKNMVFGSRRDRDEGFFFGKIDDVRIYDCAISDSMVDALYDKKTLSISKPEVVSNSVSLSPNPTSDQLSIRISDGNIQKVELVTMDGRVIKTVLVDDIEELQLNVSDMAEGIYMARIIQSDHSISTAKVLIRR